jgi:catechol 2,3-dioxygenase-like lactoylglutathione lyase family enzyme
MAIRNVLAGVAVKDLDAATAWYGKLIGCPPHSRPMAELAEWEFARGGWLQVFEDAARAGSSSVTFAEDDLDGRLAELKKLGIGIGQTSESDYVRVAIIADPDGNQLVFAQARTANNRALS